MITKLEWTQSNAQQNIEQLQNPTINNQQRINNNRTTAFERTAAKATGGLKCILLVPNLRPGFQNFKKKCKDYQLNVAQIYKMATRLPVKCSSN